MVADRLTDGVRIAQLLASEVTGDESRLRGLTVVDADPDVEPTTDGALAYRIAVEAHGDDRDARDADGLLDPVAEVFVQPDRARIEALAAPEAAATAATEADLRVRPKASRPPRTLVFVEDGAQVKRALTVLETLWSESDADRP
ncbi:MULTISPECIES: hypothetical protein [Halorubrum]|uniref:DUF7993 domain-containing protein n=1 Tax=Halorubrum hochstenium ATCC 700873 TaxID=1227481 RepID=M0FD83_9EURY|nr:MULTISPECIES: hypothetical protein [Halorubrum]ELZ57202.1 hypothetical protein C467_07255 [Halorubrum hochstenium ATCC 700873]